MSIFTRVAGVAGLALLAASCGSDAKIETASSAAPSAAATTRATTPATTAQVAEGSVFTAASAGGATITLTAKPVKIVSLSPTHTEMLFAIGAGAQVIAVDDQSNFPAEASKVASTLSGFTPNIEAIAGYKPDLVVIADDSNGVGEQLAKLKIPTWSGPAATSLDDVYAQIEQLGALTGHVADAVAVTAQMTKDVADITAQIPKLDKPMTYYHELDPTYYSSTSKTFIGQIYQMAGLQNIADKADDGSGYPQLSSEFIVSASPDLIFLADTKCCAQTKETVAARDGWSAIAAVKNGNVINMDDDTASRWGPRVVDYLRAVAEAVKAAASVSAG